MATTKAYRVLGDAERETERLYVVNSSKGSPYVCLSARVPGAAPEAAG